MMHGYRSTPLDQWGNPTGWIGWMTGRVMAVKNTAMNRAAIAHLDLRPDDRVLEIGFGPGKALRAVAERLPDGFIAGLDQSPVMVRQARKRNRKGIRRGTVEVRLGSVSRIPHGDNTFDKAFAVNSFQYWPVPDIAMAELHRVLRPGGTLVLAIRAVKTPLPFDITDAREGMGRIERARAAMAAAGLDDICTEWHRLWHNFAVCVIARKRAGAQPPPDRVQGEQP